MRLLPGSGLYAADAAAMEHHHPLAALFAAVIQRPRAVVGKNVLPHQGVHSGGMAEWRDPVAKPHPVAAVPVGFWHFNRRAGEVAGFGLRVEPRPAKKKDRPFVFHNQHILTTLDNRQQQRGEGVQRGVPVHRRMHP